LFDLLREMGEYDSTVIVAVADHGEQFFEPSEFDFGTGTFRHGQVYFDPVVRVPLIIKPAADSKLGGG